MEDGTVAAERAGKTGCDRVNFRALACGIEELVTMLGVRGVVTALGIAGVQVGEESGVEVGGKYT